MAWWYGLPEQREKACSLSRKGVPHVVGSGLVSELYPKGGRLVALAFLGLTGYLGFARLFVNMNFISSAKYFSFFFFFTGQQRARSFFMNT